VIDDSYNSNPQGAKMALEILSSFDGYKIIITPGMVELGEKQYELNFAFGKQIAATCDAVFLVGKSQTQSIYEGIVSAGYNMDNVYVVPSFQDAMSAAKAFITGDKKKVILIENDLPDNY
jgi:UDP-N-acetylmuramoyl-tripeptide--D-alanyl-D-alanine ligase